MAAPLGNQFWKMRSKHGRDKIFKTPEIMWEAACEYFQWCDENPFKKQEAKTVNVGNFQSQIETIDLNVMRPYTWEGLCIFLDTNTVYFNHFEKNVSDKTDELSKDFSKTITRIRDVIRTQKFSGAASGFFNANIIARDLGLKENTDVTTGGDKLPTQNVIDLSKLDTETLKKLTE